MTRPWFANKSKIRLLPLYQPISKTGIVVLALSLILMIGGLLTVTLTHTEPRLLDMTALRRGGWSACFFGMAILVYGLLKKTER